MSVRIRPLEEGDARPLAQALAGLRIFTDYGLTADLLTDRWLRARSESEELRLAEEGGQLLGLARYLVSGTFGGGAYLRTLAVVPHAQGRGVGSLLLRHFELEVGDPPGGCFLLASGFNLPAHGFYRAHGYREVGVLPGFAREGIDERIFWKPRPHPR